MHDAWRLGARLEPRLIFDGGLRSICRKHCRAQAVWNQCPFDFCCQESHAPEQAGLAGYQWLGSAPAGACSWAGFFTAESEYWAPRL
eukprot:4184274-Pyramimonas_sp.AAC.1